MSTFIGKYEAKLDAKGRVFVPSAYRKLLPVAEKQRVVMQKDFENNCIILFPEPVWEKKVEELKSNLDEWNPEDQILLMQFVSDAEWLEIDAQGRVLISKRHLQSIGVDESDILFVGMIDRFALWGQLQYEKARIDATVFAQRIREKMMKKTIDAEVSE